LFIRAQPADERPRDQAASGAAFDLVHRTGPRQPVPAGRGRGSERKRCEYQRKSDSNDYIHKSLARVTRRPRLSLPLRNIVSERTARVGRSV
jgi:hypothetical protein